MVTWEGSCQGGLLGGWVGFWECGRQPGMAAGRAPRSAAWVGVGGYGEGARWTMTGTPSEALGAWSGWALEGRWERRGGTGWLAVGGVATGVDMR